MEITQEVIKRDFCPHCQNYIDKRSIFKDWKSGVELPMGTVKDCKFHTNTSWICDFKEAENGNDD